MADRVHAAGEDDTFAHYLWDSGWLVSFNKQTRQWTKQRIPHPLDECFTIVPNREAAPDVGGDDD